MQYAYPSNSIAKEHAPEIVNEINSLIKKDFS